MDTRTMCRHLFALGSQHLCMIQIIFVFDTDRNICVKPSHSVLCVLEVQIDGHCVKGEQNCGFKPLFQICDKNSRPRASTPPDNISLVAFGNLIKWQK